MTRDRSGAGPSGHEPSIRLDKYLWYARLSPNRAGAQALASRGIIRLNGRRVERAHVPVRVGDLLTLPIGQQVRIIVVVTLPERRGAAAEARLCYSAVTPGASGERAHDAASTA